jgi:uncharacterized membrane protein
VEGRPSRRRHNGWHARGVLTGDDAVGGVWRVEVERVPAIVDFAVAPRNTAAARNNSRAVALESRSARSRAVWRCSTGAARKMKMGEEETGGGYVRGKEVRLGEGRK